MTRIAFLADAHVDSYGSGIDPATGLNARLADMLASLRWAAADARKQGAEALVVCGDLTERKHAPAWLVAHIRDALAEGPVRQVYLRGNHDAEVGGRSIVDVLDDGEGDRTGAARPTETWVGDTTIACLPYADRHHLRTLTGMETAPEGDVRRLLAEQLLMVARGLYAGIEADAPKVLILHQVIGGAWLSEQQQAFFGDVDTVLDGRALAAMGFDLVVAGHLHRHQTVVETPECDVLYVGSLDRVDFAEAAHPKGYVLADIERGATTWRFVENPIARRWITLSGSDEPGDVGGAIVRGRDLDPDRDLASLRRHLLAAGAFDVRDLAHAPVGSRTPTSGLSEGLTPEASLDAYFAEDPDREALGLRGRAVLQEVAA